MKKLIFVFISIIIVSCSAKKSEDKSLKQLSKLIDTYANKTLEKGNINALAIAVYKDGKVYHNYYGEEFKNNLKKLNDETLFEIASISKIVTGTLVAKAVLDEKIALDDDIRKYLNDEYPNLEYKNTPITIKNLLTHTLGFKEKKPKKLKEIEEKIGQGFYEKKPINYNKKDFLDELKTVELNKKPGTVYEYNTVGTELLALILEEVYDDNFQNLLNKFLNKLNMQNTYLKNIPEKQHNKILAGYNKEGRIAPRNRSVLTGAGGGMVATLPDLVKFMKFQLESKKPVIKESTRKLFENNEDNKLGYLWDVGKAKVEGFYYLKTGTSLGTQSVILICPDTNYGLILIANNTSQKSYYDWINLYNQIEKDLIKYPLVNLVSTLEEKLIENTENSIKEYKKLIKDSNTYYSNVNDLNNLGYILLNSGKTEKAILIFKLLVSEFPNNFNSYDSLGEAYYINKEYQKSLDNYKKSLQLNKKNKNAEQYISKLNRIITNTETAPKKH